MALFAHQNDSAKPSACSTVALWLGHAYQSMLPALLCMYLEISGAAASIIYVGSSMLHGAAQHVF